MRLRQRLINRSTFIATILPSDQLQLTETRERCRGVVFSGSPRALDRHALQHTLQLSAPWWVAPMNTRSRLRRGHFLQRVVVEHHLQALVFITYFVVTILVLYHVHQSRL